MNTLTTRPASALALMAERCAVDPAKLHETLKNTVFKGATDDEMLALVVTANTYELNPLLKELYAFPKKGGGITPMVGIDGWLKIANRQPNYDGMEVDVYGTDKTPTHATCEIFLKDRSHSVKITEYYEECRRNTDPWTQMPRRMLRNKAIIQAVRVAFGIGGIHDEDESEDISIRDVTPRTSKAVLRETMIEPFESLPAPAAEVKAEPAPQPAADPAPNPETKTPEGRQQKERIMRDASFKSITEKSSGGKTWWEVSLGISGKTVSFTTFSKTLSGSLFEMEKGTHIRATIVPSGEGFSLEDYTLIETEGGLV
jgi:phage recombination protein Bet